MPSRPARITNVTSPEGVHVLNQLLREITGRLDDIQKQVSPHAQLKTTGTLVFGTVPAQSSTEATLYMAGANTKGVAHASPAQGLALGNANLIWSAYVSTQNQVKVRIMNPTGSGVAVNTVLWNVSVIQ